MRRNCGAASLDSRNVETESQNIPNNRGDHEKKKLLAHDCNAAAFIRWPRRHVWSNKECEGDHSAAETARAARRSGMAVRSYLGQLEPGGRRPIAQAGIALRRLWCDVG
jgi:hypothetical protein